MSSSVAAFSVQRLAAVGSGIQLIASHVLPCERSTTELSEIGGFEPELLDGAEAGILGELNLVPVLAAVTVVSRKKARAAADPASCRRPSRADRRRIESAPARRRECAWPARVQVLPLSSLASSTPNMVTSPGVEIAGDEDVRAEALDRGEFEIHRARVVFRAGQTERLCVLRRADVVELLNALRHFLHGLRVERDRSDNRGEEGPHGVLHFNRIEWTYNESVAGPLIPTPFDHIGRRRFSFYPAIVGIEHNEWSLRRMNSSEVQVANTKSAEEIWIPRRFLGEISASEDPFLIVGLVKELEYQAGMVLPHQRRVIQMPRAVNGSAPLAARAPRPPKLAPVVGIRVESGPASRAGKRLLTWIVAGILACIAAAETLMVFGGHRAAASRRPAVHNLPFGDRHVPLPPGDVDPQQH